MRGRGSGRFAGQFWIHHANEQFSPVSRVGESRLKQVLPPEAVHWRNISQYSECRARHISTARRSAAQGGLHPRSHPRSFAFVYFASSVDHQVQSNFLKAQQGSTQSSWRIQNKCRDCTCICTGKPSLLAKGRCLERFKCGQTARLAFTFQILASTFDNTRASDNHHLGFVCRLCQHTLPFELNANKRVNKGPSSSHQHGLRRIRR